MLSSNPALAPYLLSALELTRASQIISAAMGESPIVGGGGGGDCIPAKKEVKKKEVRKVLNQTTILRDSLINSARCQTLFHLSSELSALMTTSTWKLFT